MTSSPSGATTYTWQGEPGTQPGVFGPEEIDELEAFYRRYGFAILRGLADEAMVEAMRADGVSAQERIAGGELSERYGTTRFNKGSLSGEQAEIVNYVTHFTELSPTADALLSHCLVEGVVARWLGPECWSARNRGNREFGFVFQDARPGAESGYSRIGWHTDWQASPHLDLTPSTAVTIHLDATSPANGFLRVVPGSQMWATPAPYENVNGALVPEGAVPARGYTDEPPPFPMPLEFEKVPGEAAVYAEAGDLLFHDAYLWHSAARASTEPAIRRHVRGGFFSGKPPERFGPEDFVKNAAR
ncbi:MAG: phytanoyl-CoA dioxygenase family protein [Acidimicrobiaceae bacterium]|nr:phytanoyl-CoA dioxygenase family protein [Acidimicrobiaceae bacterium]MBO0746746.1 phytanoyl-CoA dioxygenase family protein [Acidimicrobiaceae bacterium]